MPIDIRAESPIPTLPGRIWATELCVQDRVHMPGGVGTVVHTSIEGQYVMLIIDQYRRLRLRRWELRTTHHALWELENE